MRAKASLYITKNSWITRLTINILQISPKIDSFNQSRKDSPGIKPSNAPTAQGYSSICWAGMVLSLSRIGNQFSDSSHRWSGFSARHLPVDAGSSTESCAQVLFHPTRYLFRKMGATSGLIHRNARQRCYRLQQTAV